MRVEGRFKMAHDYGYAGKIMRGVASGLQTHATLDGLNLGDVADDLAGRGLVKWA